MDLQQFIGDGGWLFTVPFAAMLGILFFPVIIVLAVWSVMWKGLGLWHAARRKEPWWFVIMLVVNTAGILEIIYLFFVAKLKFSELFSSHEHRV